MSFIDKCRHLIGLDTTPSRGTKEAAEYLGELFKSAGLHVQYQREILNGVEQCNVIARASEEIPEAELLLQTHLDTVDAGHFSLWTRTQSNPFNASIYNEWIYGLGVAESKLDILCKLEATKKVIGKKMKRPFVLVGTFGAQHGMAGAIKLIRKKLIRPRWALIGSPTSLSMVVAGQGLAVLEVFVPFSPEEQDYRRRHDMQESSSSQSRMFGGKAAHSSDPDKGENAIMKMLTYLSQLPSGIALMDIDGGINYNSVPSSAVLEIDMMGGFQDPIVPKLSNIHSALVDLQKRLAEFHDSRFDPPHPTMNLGTIRTGEDGVILTGSCRLPPTVTDHVYEQWMSALKMVCAETKATFRVREYRKGFETNIKSELVQVAAATLQDIGLTSTPQAFTGATEASVFSRWGAECLVWGPGQSVGNSHALNESIRIKDLDAAMEFYGRFLERFCL